MEERVKEFNMGLAVDPQDTNEVIATIECLLDERAFRSKVGEPGFTRCREVHSVEALKPAFERILAGI
jgi:hypothetical protein